MMEHVKKSPEKNRPAGGYAAKCSSTRNRSCHFVSAYSSGSSMGGQLDRVLLFTIDGDHAMSDVYGV